MIDSKEVTALQQLIALSEDQTAYVRLYRIYCIPLTRFAHTIVKLKPVAEEIVSDVFLQVWQMRKKLDTIHNLTVYLYTCTRHHSLNFLAKRKLQITALFDEDNLSIPSTALNPEQLCISAELVKEMDQAIQQLPPRCRLIFKLVREDGLKYREVAEVLNISQKTVEAQIGIAMKKLNDAIQPNARHTPHFTSKKGE